MSSLRYQLFPRESATFVIVRDEDARDLAAAWIPDSDSLSCLLPIRFDMNDDAPDGQWASRREDELSTQAKNLSTKLAVLDRFGLSDRKFAELFSSGRLFLGRPNGTTTDVNVARGIVAHLEEAFGKRLVSQLDYDQRRKHPHIGGLLDAVELRTRHDPSAVATVTAFLRLLGREARSQGGTTIAVRGVGELGSRIVQLLVETDIERVFVYDHDPDKMKPLGNLPRVEVAGDDALLDLPVTAHVFAADTGSLSVDSAHRVLAAGTASAVGGPEAGLDRGTDAVDLLARSGIHFVPSVLCGSMGLVSNLEEILGFPSDLGEQSKRLGKVIDAAAARGERYGVPFHEALRSYIEVSA